MEEPVERRLPTVVNPENVAVPVAVMFVAVRLPVKNPLPETESLANGEVVPTPTFPDAVAKYVEPVEEKIDVEALANV